MDYKNLDVFSPIILVILVVMYLLFSLVGFTYHLKELVGVNFITIEVIFAGLLMYVIGIGISKYLLNKKQLICKESLIEKLTSERLILSLVILGLLLQVVNMLYLGGIPLLSGYLKAQAATRIWLLSYLIFLPTINILLAKYQNKWYYILLLCGLILFSLTGYRTTAMAIIISALITIYYTRDLPWKYLIVSVVCIFLLLMVIGYIAVKSIEWQTWTLNPLQLIFYRAGYTLQVLDHAVGLQTSTHGLLLYNTLMGFFQSTDPRVIVGMTTLGYAHSTTSTIFGPALLDFGLNAMILQMIVLGFVLTTVYIIQKQLKGIFTALYAILLAHSLIWIETGPTDLVVFLFFVITIILMICTVRIKGNGSVD